MERKVVNSRNELQLALGTALNFDNLKPFVFRDLDFNFDLGDNFSELQSLKHSSNNGSIAHSFNSIKCYIFINCRFNFKIKIFHEYPIKLTFQENCVINDLDFGDATIKENIRFYECHFEGECNFHNTKFSDLADFWNSTFYLPTNFYKTDFMGTTVFSACTFKENALFTYTLFKERIFYRGAIFEKGLDLSLAIDLGEYNFFNLSIGNYVSVKSDSETTYNGLIEKSEIPIINKKETFRIIKQYFKDKGDDLEYVKYLRLEKKPIYEIIIGNLNKTERNHWWNYIHHLFDLISLGLNRFSNNHRNSYILGILFTVLIGLLFFSLTLLTLPNFGIVWEPSNWSKEGIWKEYLTFMNPTHEIKLFDGFSPNGWTYFWQTWGRIFVGYGIYQTIQAFRKLK
jgi:hypothetical protein